MRREMREGERPRVEKRENGGGGWRKKKRRRRWVGLGQPDPNRFLNETLPSLVMDRVASSFNPISPSLKPYKPNLKIQLKIQ